MQSYLMNHSIAVSKLFDLDSLELTSKLAAAFYVFYLRKDTHFLCFI